MIVKTSTLSLVNACSVTLDMHSITTTIVLRVKKKEEIQIVTNLRMEYV